MSNEPANEPPFDVDVRLDGWRLFWGRLESTGAAADLGRLRAETTEAIRRRLELESLSQHPTVAALRRLFKEAGCDPSRYRPSSEALLRRLLKGDPMPEIHPLVDLNNCLSALLAVPCCVMDEARLEPPFVLRAGVEGESYESLRGAFRLEQKPLLVDAAGPCDAPITGGVRVKVRADTRSVWLVAYMPEAVSEEDALGELRRLLAAAPVATLDRWFSVTATAGA